jgi:hypothetical protein
MLVLRSELVPMRMSSYKRARVASLLSDFLSHYVTTLAHTPTLWCHAPETFTRAKQKPVPWS